MKKLLFFGSLFLSNLSFSQNFVYSFNGGLSEENKEKLIAKIDQLHFFEEIKFKEKENNGQLFFTIPLSSSSEGDKNAPYTTSTIKAFLIEAGLEPIDIYQR